MSTIGRNELCPCGSGLKYKRCCALKAGRSSISGRVVMSLIGLMLLCGAIYMLAALNEPGDGVLGPRRVWSEEHGHWH
jgi:SEC-C motif